MLQSAAALQPAGVREGAGGSSQLPKRPSGEQKRMTLYFMLFLFAFLQ